MYILCDLHLGNVLLLFLERLGQAVHIPVQLLDASPVGVELLYLGHDLGVREVQVDGLRPVDQHVLVGEELQVFQLVAGTEDAEAPVQFPVGLRKKFQFVRQKR